MNPMNEAWKLLKGEQPARAMKNAMSSVKTDLNLRENQVSDEQLQEEVARKLGRGAEGRTEMEVAEEAFQPRRPHPYYLNMRPHTIPPSRRTPQQASQVREERIATDPYSRDV